MEIINSLISLFGTGFSIGIVYGVLVLVALEVLHIFKKTTE